MSSILSSSNQINTPANNQNPARFQLNLNQSHSLSTTTNAKKSNVNQRSELSIELDANGEIVFNYSNNRSQKVGNAESSSTERTDQPVYQRTHGHRGVSARAPEGGSGATKGVSLDDNEGKSLNGSPRNKDLFTVTARSNITNVRHLSRAKGQVSLLLEMENTLLSTASPALVPLPEASATTPPPSGQEDATEMDTMVKAENDSGNVVAKTTTNFEIKVAEKDYNAFFKIRMKSQLDPLSRYNTIVVAALVAAMICILAGISTTDWLTYRLRSIDGGSQSLTFGLFSTCFLGSCSISTYDAPDDPNSLFFVAAPQPVCVVSGHQWTIRAGVVRVFSFFNLVSLAISFILSLVINQRPTKVRTQILVASFILASGICFYLPALVVYDRTFRANYLYCNISPCTYALRSPNVRSCEQESGWGFWLFAVSAPCAAIAFLASVAITVRILYLRRLLLKTEGLLFIKQYLQTAASMPISSSIDAKIGANYVKAVEDSFTNITAPDAMDTAEHSAPPAQTRRKLLNFLPSKGQRKDEEVSVFSGPDKSSKQILRPTRLVATEGLQVTADIFNLHAKKEENVVASEWILDMESQLMYNTRLNCFWDQYSQKYYLIDEGVWTNEKPMPKEDAYRSLFKN